MVHNPTFGGRFVVASSSPMRHRFATHMPTGVDRGATSRHPVDDAGVGRSGPDSAPGNRHRADIILMRAVIAHRSPAVP